MPENESSLILKEISEDTIFIIGAGHFGNRAVRILSQESDAPLFVVDVDEWNSFPG
jgi:phosphoglycerate dehydrogenase-like enzyme